MACLFGLVGCTTKEIPGGSSDKPDVVLVSIDTLRADHLGAWGYHRDTSPFMDSLASSGVRYSHARSPSPWTLPTHVTLLSGVLPPSHGVVEDDMAVSPSLGLLQEVMREQGFRTGGFVSTLYVSQLYGFDRGFDVFDDFGLQTPKENLAGNVPAKRVVDRALKWMRSLPEGEPAFLFLHFYDTHYEYDPPAPYSTMFDRAPRRDDPKYRTYAYHRRNPPNDQQMEHQVAQYDEAIRYVDDQLKRLQDLMAEAGREATWLVTADHGEEFGERGSWGHAHTLYPEQLHVPLILQGARIDEVKVEETAVGLEDIAPTLAALVGGSLPGAEGVDLLRQEGIPDRGFISETSRFSTNRLGWWEGGWRFDLDLKSDARAVYNTGEDPAERDNLIETEEERAAALMDRMLKAAGEPWEVKERARLRSEGVFMKDGVMRGRRLSARPGDRFQVVPFDAVIEHDELRFRAGSAIPEGSPLVYHGPESLSVTLTEQQRKQLEALGYVE